MKTTRLNKLRNSGSALIVTLTVVVITTAMLGTYLTLVQYQTSSVARSQAWNSVIPVSEAGVEEALSEINNGVPVVLGTNIDVTGGWKWTNNVTADGWSPFTNGITTVTRYVSGSNYYKASIDISSGIPVINSIGNISFTTTPWVFGAAMPFLASAQGQLNGGTSTVGRQVQVQTGFTPLFTYSLLTKLGINANGNSISSDAFDSSNPLYSTNGAYIASKATDGGNVGTLSGAANAINVGGGTIYGHVATGPGGTIPGSLKIGDHVWLASNSGQEPGFVTQDMNAILQDVPAPTFAGISLPAAVSGVRTLNGNYTVTSGTLSGKIVVTGDTSIYVQPSATVTFNGSSDSITITNNAMLRLYVGCASATLPNIANATGRSVNFVYLGMAANTALNMTVNADFVGTIYAPNAVVTLGGNGQGSDQKILGACVCKSINYNDLFSFHYDMALKKIGPNRGWVVTSWSEVKNP